RGEVLTSRAAALVSGNVRRLANRFSWLMPPRVDLGIYLAVDRDPVAGELVALGCHVARPDGRNEQTIALARTPDEERQALRRVLGEVLTVLTEVDTENRRDSGTNGTYAHVFLYEPAEGRDLQEALGRHLSDDAIRSGLL